VFPKLPRAYKQKFGLLIRKSRQEKDIDTACSRTRKSSLHFHERTHLATNGPQRIIVPVGIVRLVLVDGTLLTFTRLLRYYLWI